MILIADSGSTKTDWALTEKTGIADMIRTIGYNPYFIDTEAMYRSLSENLLPKLGSRKPAEIYFYGAGCMAPEKKAIAKAALEKAFPDVKSIFVGHDLLAAARALLGDQDGFAAILGTGSNTCLYKNGECELNIDSLGYLLGDEGSGSYIGKRLLRDYMRGLMDDSLRDQFKAYFKIDNNEGIFHDLYNAEFKNRYLAGFCRFADEFSGHPYIRNVVRESFGDFFKNLVSKYPNYKQYAFNCIGSVAFVFRNILEEVALSYDMKTGKVMRAPLDDLVTFHLDHTRIA